MSNLRIVYDNVADNATLAASSTAGSLIVDNLKTDIKSEIWRSTGTSATITLTWSPGEIIGMLAMPFCSLTAAATFRVRAYITAADALPAVDTGVQMACPGTPFGEWEWGMVPLGVNAYSYGGGTYGVIWFPASAYEKIVLDIDDSSNPLGYIEASRIVAGAYWSPVNNTEYGAEITLVDTSKQERSDAGDLKTDRGTLHKVLSFDLSLMPSTDRNALWNILRGNGMYSPIYVSLTPESTDSTEEQIFQVYGKLSKQSPIRYQFINQFNTSVEIEEA